LPYFDECSECKAENLATAFAVSGHSDLNGLPAGFDPKATFDDAALTGSLPLSGPGR
jgi:hypothetical protein